MKKTARRTTVFLIFLGAIALLIAHAGHYYPFLVDDALISLRYAYRLVEGNGLTWTDGRPVEGYSNLSWVLLNAFMYWIGVDPIDSSRLLGLLGMGMVVIALLGYWRLFTDAIGGNLIPVIVGLLFFSLAAPIAVWTIGGLEQPLMAGLIAFAVTLSVRLIESTEILKPWMRWLSLVLGLICLTRPDGPIFVVASIASIFIGRIMQGRKPLSLSQVAVLASLPGLFFFGQLLFRLVYYGEVVPNTALVRIIPSIRYFKNGAGYLFSAWWALLPFSLFALLSLVAAWVKPDRRGRAIPAMLIFMLWSPYVIFIGGETFPAYRLVIPLIVVFSFALVEGAGMALQAAGNKPKYSVLLGGALFFSMLIFLSRQFADSENQRANRERFEWDNQVLGLLLKRAFSTQQPLIAVTAAGSIPYWSRLPALDMLGLNDYHIPRHSPERIGNYFPGHEMGDGKYVLSRRPDIIVFHNGWLRDLFRSGSEMQQLVEFQELYTPVTVLGNHPRPHKGTIWFYKYSRKIGVQRSKTEIRIPGFLLTGPSTIAHLNETGRLVMTIPHGQGADIALGAVVEQDWRVSVRSSGRGNLRTRWRWTGERLQMTFFSLDGCPCEIDEIILTRK